jgi:hypothetical protein
VTHEFYDCVKLLRSLSQRHQVMALFAAQNWTADHLSEQEMQTGGVFPSACDCDRCVAVRAGGGKIVSIGRSA